MAKGKKLSVPRDMTEIQQEYQNVCFNAGQVQYQISVYTKELESINQRLFNINNEAAARRKLDDAKAKDAAATPVVSDKAVANG